MFADRHEIAAKPEYFDLHDGEITLPAALY
jgi:hypothetical protein